VNGSSKTFTHPEETEGSWAEALTAPRSSPGGTLSAMVGFAMIAEIYSRGFGYS
jgi:hypothetical protein